MLSSSRHTTRRRRLTLVAARQRRFCRAVHEEAGGEIRWATIVAIARRLDMDVRVAILLGAAAGYVWLDVKGP